MTPDKALELVGKYSRLTRAITLCKSRIGENLDKCPGLRGKRLELFKVGAFDAGEAIGFIEAYEMPTDAAMEDQETHLKFWYERDMGDDGRYSYGEPDADECQHCYAAHLVVQERKQLRRKLAAVKGSMTRATVQTNGELKA